MKKILISACLIGDKTRYDGRSNYHPLVKELNKKYDLVPFCGEVEGGLPIPRHPSERQKDGSVKMDNGKDVTKNYREGAEKCLNLCLYLGIDTVVLKENSPSCGTHKIYDGTFSHTLIDGMGVLAEHLKKHGINVYSENEIEELLK